MTDSTKPAEKTSSLWPARTRKKSGRHRVIEAEKRLEEALTGLHAAKEENETTYRDFFDAQDIAR